jgi:hypothetical protein
MLIVDYGREGIQWASDSLAEIGTFTKGSSVKWIDKAQRKVTLS